MRVTAAVSNRDWHRLLQAVCLVQMELSASASSVMCVCVVICVDPVLSSVPPLWSETISRTRQQLKQSLSARAQHSGSIGPVCVWSFINILNEVVEVITIPSALSRFKKC